MRKAAFILFLGCAACANPIVGTWEASDLVGGQRSELTIEEKDSGLEGEAEIYFQLEDVVARGDYDFEADDKGDGEYEVDLEAKSVCNIANPTDCVESKDFATFSPDLTCELNSDETELDCEADNQGTHWEMTFEKKD